MAGDYFTGWEQLAKLVDYDVEKEKEQKKEEKNPLTIPQF